MIPLAALIPTALGFAKSNWRAIAGAVLGAALALPVGQCQGASAERAKLRADIAEAHARAEAANAALLERAGRERAADAAKITAAAKGRSDAIHAGPDARPSGPECRLARKRLLDAGAREADLPVCD